VPLRRLSKASQKAVALLAFILTRAFPTGSAERPSRSLRSRAFRPRRLLAGHDRGLRLSVLPDPGVAWSLSRLQPSRGFSVGRPPMQKPLRRWVMGSLEDAGLSPDRRLLDSHRRGSLLSAQWVGLQGACATPCRPTRRTCIRGRKRSTSLFVSRKHKTATRAARGNPGSKRISRQFVHRTLLLWSLLPEATGRSARAIAAASGESMVSGHGIAADPRVSPCWKWLLSPPECSRIEHSRSPDTHDAMKAVSPARSRFLADSRRRVRRQAREPVAVARQPEKNLDRLAAHRRRGVDDDDPRRSGRGSRALRRRRGARALSPARDGAWRASVDAPLSFRGAIDRPSS